VVEWRSRQARGEVRIARYADDFVVGFQRRDDAERFRAEGRRRIRKKRRGLTTDYTDGTDGRRADTALERAQIGAGEEKTFGEASPGFHPYRFFLLLGLVPGFFLSVPSV